MFLGIDLQDRQSLAIIDDIGYKVTYGELCDTINQFDELSLPRSIVFCLCENCAGALVGYLAFESNRQIPLLLSAQLDRDLLCELDKIYTPSYYWIPKRLMEDIDGDKVAEFYDYVLIRTEHEPYFVNDELSLLLTTSGSTGSPKLVRHKYGNLEANAHNVAAAFGWKKEERGICDLPMNYTMGLNVINSHIVAGASVLMMRRNLMDPLFWEFIKENEGTNFCGVPYSYDILRRIGFEKMDLPKLRTMAEGGGKLTDKMFEWIARYCHNSGKRFCATFGTSETSARMSMLPPEIACERIGSIGKAIPNGELFLVDEKQNEDGSADGELGYRGPNVTMGYAVCREDLLKGDVFCGEYHTGDIARRDSDGFYYIIGRKKRFLKLFGLRVSLDEIERIIKTQFACEVVCTGNDKCMKIFITDPNLETEICPFISKKTNLHISVFRVIVLSQIPRNSYGKVQFSELDKLSENL